MPTFLVTAKMNPALADRVAKSVHGGKASSPVSRRLTSWARFGFVGAVALSIWLVLGSRKREARELDHDKVVLLDKIKAHTDALEPWDRDQAKRGEIALRAREDAEVIAPEIKGPGKLEALLKQPLVYVRAPAELGAKITEAAATSQKDALLLCMLSPPSARQEKVVLDKVRVAYMGGPGVEEATSNVRRLNDVVLGLPYLLPPYSDRVRASQERAAVAVLRADFDRINVERTKQAAKAGLMLVVIDEPGDGKGPTELDGERSHDIRITLRDLRAERTLLNVRRHVDPSWISQARRPTYAAGLDGCALAYDVHEQLKTAR